MFEIKMNADNKPLAAAIGRALLEYGDGAAALSSTTTITETSVGDVKHAVTVTKTGDDSTSALDHVDETHTADDGTGHAATTATEATAADNNGVLKNDAFCSTAAKPFYASGPRSGQWKKRQGVDDAAYDAWYAGELAKVQSAAAGSGGTGGEPRSGGGSGGTIDTSSAFGGDAAPAGNTETVPHDSGTLMAWVAERQTAGLTSQTDVNTAWENCDLSMGDIFAPNTPEVIAENCSRIYYRICKLAGE